MVEDAYCAASLPAWASYGMQRAEDDERKQNESNIKLYLCTVG